MGKRKRKSRVQEAESFTLIKRNRYYKPVMAGIVFLMIICLVVIAVEEWENRPPPTQKPSSAEVDLGSRFAFIEKSASGSCPSSYTPFNATSCLKLNLPIQ